MLQTVAGGGLNRQVFRGRRDFEERQEAEYERSGDVPDVVFPCGWILEDDRRTVRLYYGAADTTVCVATGDLEEIIGHLYRHCICGNPHEPGERCPVTASEPVEMTGN